MKRAKFPLGFPTLKKKFTAKPNLCIHHSCTPNPPHPHPPPLQLPPPLLPLPHPTSLPHPPHRYRLQQKKSKTNTPCPPFSPHFHSPSHTATYFSPPSHHRADRAHPHPLSAKQRPTAPTTLRTKTQTKLPIQTAVLPPAAIPFRQNVRAGYEVPPILDGVWNWVGVFKIDATTPRPFVNAATVAVPSSVVGVMLLVCSCWAIGSCVRLRASRIVWRVTMAKFNARRAKGLANSPPG